MASLGIDIHCVTDLDPMFRLVSGPTAVAQRHARRFQTPTGQLLEHAEYGYDVRNLLNASSGATTLYRLKSIIEQQMLRDDETEAAEVDVTFVESTNKLTLHVKGQTAQGPFSLVLGVDDLTVDILEAAATT